MKNLILDTHAGDSFTSVSKKAKEWSIEKNNIVEFEFNGITCLVSKGTNLEWLYRDYCNAHYMDWKTVGYVCVKEYSKEIQDTLDAKKKEAEKRSEERSRQYAEKEKNKKEALMTIIGNVELELSDAGIMKDFEEKNTDGYGGRCVSYAKEWGKLMQAEMANGKNLRDIAEETSHRCDYDGITGFMYGMAVNILSQCWKHGEELRKWHNKEYGVSEDKKGVVNPAILTIGADGGNS